MSEKLRAIDVECPDCGSGPGDPCISLKDLHNPRNTGFMHREVKNLHAGRYWEARFLRSVSTKSTMKGRR
jgi:hypothetical protein